MSLKPCGCDTETSCECKSTNTTGLRFKVGDKVRHPADGIGTVVEVDSGCKSGTLYRIDFGWEFFPWRSQAWLIPADQHGSNVGERVTCQHCGANVEIEDGKIAEHSVPTPGLPGKIRCHGSGHRQEPSILTEAESIVSGRDSTYGTPERNLERIAARWSTVFGHPVTPEQVCICMIDVKLSRLTHTPWHRDSLVDVVGYARLYEVAREGK